MRYKDKLAIELQFTDIMIGEAARDPRIREIATLMLFKSECPEGRIYEAELCADVASHYALSPDGMQQVFEIYERSLISE